MQIFCIKKWKKWVFCVKKCINLKIKNYKQIFLLMYLWKILKLFSKIKLYLLSKKLPFLSVIFLNFKKGVLLIKSISLFPLFFWFQIFLILVSFFCKVFNMLLFHGNAEHFGYSVSGEKFIFITSRFKQNNNSSVNIVNSFAHARCNQSFFKVSTWKYV